MAKKIYQWGIGGRHRNTDEARRFRELTTHIAGNVRAVHPKMDVAFVIIHAYDHARRVGYALERIRQVELDEMPIGAW